MVRPFVRHYDSIYADKDYDSDIAVLKTFCGASLGGQRILEVGSGTANHTIRLASLVREIVGIDVDVDFGKLARRKLDLAGTANVVLKVLPLEQLDDGDFDGAVALFNVLNYLAPNLRAPFAEALAARLKPGAWFLADLWNGDVVLADPPLHETRHKANGSTRIRQDITPRLDAHAGTLALRYEIDVEQGADVEHFSEQLLMHVWPLSDVERTFRVAGFDDIDFRDRRRFPAKIAGDSWHAWMHAKKR